MADVVRKFLLITSDGEITVKNSSKASGIEMEGSQDEIMKADTILRVTMVSNVEIYVDVLKERLPFNVSRPFLGR